MQIIYRNGFWWIKMLGFTRRTFQARIQLHGKKYLLLGNHWRTIRGIYLLRTGIFLQIISKCWYHSLKNQIFLSVGLLPETEAHGSG